MFSSLWDKVRRDVHVLVDYHRDGVNVALQVAAPGAESPPGVWDNLEVDVDSALNLEGEGVILDVARSLIGDGDYPSTDSHDLRLHCVGLAASHSVV